MSGGADTGRPHALAGKTALVTGAGKGLGRAIALALDEAGASVTAVARTEADLKSLQQARPSIATWAEDVTGDAFIDRLEGLKHLDILVNNAGSNQPEPVVDVSDDTLDWLLNLNVRSLFRACRAAARVMQHQGSGAIINMSSQMGHVGSPGRSVYCMTKHAVEGLTKAMAVELGPVGIRVNSLAPTFVETPLTKPMLEKPEFRDFVKRMIPLGRIASTDDIAAAAVYLASPAASMINGHSLLIDGGWTAQ